MQAEKDSLWLSQMASALVSEITERMAGIRLEHRPRAQEPAVEMDMICGLVDGDVPMGVHFRAEPRLYRRLAQGILADEPMSEKMVQDCALEFFNVLCGRFVSEIQRMTRSPAQLRPARFMLTYEHDRIYQEDMMCVLCFSSDKQEMAEFFWTRQPIEELLKRSAVQ